MVDPTDRQAPHSGAFPPEPADFEIAPRSVCDNPAFDYRKLDADTHLSPAHASHFPRAKPGERMLDLGCGDARFRQIASHTGHTYVGVDFTPDATVKADAHFLPFPPASFDFVLSLAALEHFRFPRVVLDQVFEVLRPGGLFAGTVAFQQPFHGRSFYHHSHLATYDGLQVAGFVDIDVAAADARACAPWSQRDGLFPGAPTSLQTALTAPIASMSRAWYRLGRVTRRGGAQNHLKNVGSAFDWLARKPEGTTD